jgi:hypothetical protein
VVPGIARGDVASRIGACRLVVYDLAGGRIAPTLLRRVIGDDLAGGESLPVLDAGVMTARSAISALARLRVGVRET